MKTIVKMLPAMAFVGLMASAGIAQTGQPAQPTAAIKSAHTVNHGGPEAGHNSFTEKQAQEHIAKLGYTDVSALKKGDDGVWRGTARKDGRTVTVTLDFKGNVATAD